MHPTVAYDLARIRIDDLHREADNERLARAARESKHHGPDLAAGSRWESREAGLDPTRLVRRLLNRLRPAFAP